MNQILKPRNMVRGLTLSGGVGEGAGWKYTLLTLPPSLPVSAIFGGVTVAAEKTKQTR